MDIIFSSLPIEKINEDKTLDLQEIQQIYNFLLTLNCRMKLNT